MVRFVKPAALVTLPRVSVVVPCYNYGHYLPQLVRLVLDQPGVDVDILIVDDASPDGSGDIAAQLAESDPRITVIRHRTNKGHIQTYNDGLAAVSGDYVVLLSADDLLPAGSLARAVALMERYPGVGFVYGYARSFSGEPPADLDPTVRNWSIWSGLDWLRVSARRGRSFIASPEVVMRREALVSVGGYDPRLPHSGDLDMWFRTAVNWDVGRVNGPIQALYRVHDANMHLTTYDGWLLDLEERRRTFNLLFDEHAAGRKDIDGLRQPAMRALAKESLRRAMINHREGLERAQVQPYIDFAARTDPAIQGTVLWKLCRFGTLQDRVLPALQTRRLASKTRHHLAWRRERRYGT